MATFENVPEMVCTDRECGSTDHTVQRRFDKHGIYAGRYCDRCWKLHDPGDYDEQGETIESEPDVSGDGLA